MIVLPHGHTYLWENQNPRSNSVEVGLPLDSHPNQGPYIGYWPSHVSFDAVHWHKIVWNRHLTIGYNVCIYFNDILKSLNDDENDENDDDNGEDRLDRLVLSSLLSSDREEDDDDDDGEVREDHQLSPL